MIRMEIALFLVLCFIAYNYFSAGKKHTPLHGIFSVILIAMPYHLALDGITIYTVAHLDTVPLWLNDLLHRLFIGTMVLIVFLFFEYIDMLVRDENGKPSRLDIPAKIYLMFAALGVAFLPIEYTVTPAGNYSSGIHVILCYVHVAFYLFLCVLTLLGNWKHISGKKKWVIGAALLIEVIFSVLQAFHPTWLISGMGLTLLTLSFYLTLENPEILRAELTEQKMSMLYLKSQINPHFLYNTLDAIRIQAQLDGDKKVSDLLMRLVDFYRLSVKVDRTLVELEDELHLIDAYMDLMCYRYPELKYECDIDPELYDMLVPNFILQPMLENSLLHGLKNLGYRGEVSITAEDHGDSVEICVSDTGIGFAEGKKEAIEQRLKRYANHETKSNSSNIGMMNVQKRIKLLCGKQYGLSYTENPGGGVTAHILLPRHMEEIQ